MVWRYSILLCVGVTCLAHAETVQGQMTDNTNVAYMKDVYGHPAGAEYYEPISHYDSWFPVPVDDIFYQAPANFCYVNREVNGYFRIDLGSVMDVNWIDLWPRGAGRWDRDLGGNAIRGLADDLSVVYEHTIPTGLTSQNYQIDVDWQDIRYVMLFDTADQPGMEDDLVLSELRVGADVPTYNRYIGNVSVTTTSEIANGWFEAVNLTNNRGMTDQGVGVGDPAAKSISTAGTWLSENLAGTSLDPVLTFDLNGSYELDEIRIWNHSFAKPTESLVNRGTQHCLIEVSNNDGLTYSPLADTNDTDPGNYTIPESPDDLSIDSYPMYDAQLAIALADVEADHVRFTCLSNYGDEMYDGVAHSYRGLSEVRFYSDDVVSRMPGDATGDQVVDRLDAARLAENWLRQDGVSWEEGDFNDDGRVDDLDASILAANWSPAAPESAVPEPSILVLLATSAFVLLL
ncbi:MAG: hypothetical protein JW818_15960, partial [Pirellulales bacterium]|nr:hypothetical protein [Pirellulales bacterium]